MIMSISTPLIRYCSRLSGFARNTTAGNSWNPRMRKLLTIRIYLPEPYKRVKLRKCEDGQQAGACGPRFRGARNLRHWTSHPKGLCEIPLIAHNAMSGAPGRRSRPRKTKPRRKARVLARDAGLAQSGVSMGKIMGPRFVVITGGCGHGSGDGVFVFGGSWNLLLLFLCQF